MKKILSILLLQPSIHYYEKKMETHTREMSLKEIAYMKKHIHVFLVMGIGLSCIIQQCYAGEYPNKSFPPPLWQTKRPCHSEQEQLRMKLITVRIVT